MKVRELCYSGTLSNTPMSLSSGKTHVHLALPTVNDTLPKTKLARLKQMCSVLGLSLGMKCFGHQTFDETIKRMSKPVLEFLVLVTDDQEEGQEQGQEEKTEYVKKNTQ